MITAAEEPRDLKTLSVPLVGALAATGDVFEPFRLVDSDGVEVAPVAVFLRDLRARGRSTATQRSYGMACLRWFRFCWAIKIPWDEVTRAEAWDFFCWIQITGKPRRPRCRDREGRLLMSAATQRQYPARMIVPGARLATGQPDPRRERRHGQHTWPPSRTGMPRARQTSKPGWTPRPPSAT
jgi:hypothetical protein